MKFFGILTLFLPPSKFKNKILNFFSNANIEKDAYVGFSYIDVKNLTLEKKATIKHFVRMKGLEKVLLKENSYIGNHNTFYCNNVIGDRGHLELGVNSELVRKNSLDLTSNITIGNNVVVGGHSSQFWTHGFDVNRNRLQGEIIINQNVYIGSSSIFNLSVSICSNVIIGAGSVVTKSIAESGLYAGVPAEKKSENYLLLESESKKLLYKKGRSDFFEKKI